MLQFFRINDPYRIFFIFLMLVAIRVAWIVFGLPLSVPELKWLLIGERLGDGFTMYKELYDHTGPLSAFVYKFLDLIFGKSRWVHLSVNTLLVLLQASIFNQTLLRNKAYDESTYLPAFFYAICMSSVMDFFALSPQLMSLTFVLASLAQIFRRIDNVVTDKLFVVSGIYIGLASGFYLPAIVFFPVFLLSFLLFSSAIARRLTLFIYGIVIIFLVTLGYFVWRSAGQEFVVDFFQVGFLKPRIFYTGLLEYLHIATALLVVWLISLSIIFTYRATNYQQKMLQVMIFFMVAALLIVFLTRDLMPSDMVFMIPTIAFYLVYYFLGLKKRIFKLLMPVLMIMGMLIYPKVWIGYNEDCDLMTSEPTMTLEPGSRVMGIGLPVNEYQEVVFAGPFLDDYITRIKIGDLDYYDASSRMYDAILDSKADYIVDKLDVAPKMLHRFPELGDQYEKVSEGIYRRITKSQ